MDKRDDFKYQLYAGPGKEFGSGLFAGLGVYSSPKRKELVQKELRSALALQIHEKRVKE